MTYTARLTVQAASAPVDAEGRSFIEVMPTVEKAKNGAWFFTITRADLEVYAQSIRANPGRIPVDYDHSSAPGGQSTRAAGWFTGEAELRDVNGSPRLWAQVEWTPAAVQQIRDGEFRFISPEFTFAEKDPKTGLMTKAKALLAAALVNRPFFAGMSPVTAARDHTSEETNMQTEDTDGMPSYEVTVAGQRAQDRALEVLAAQGISEPTYEQLNAALAVAESEGFAVDERVDPGEPIENIVHARAMEILAGRGIELTHTSEEYHAAYAQAAQLHAVQS